MKKILIIEDDAVFSGIYRRKYEDMGYQVEVMVEGNAGFEKAQTFKPDVIQMDLMLARVNGVEIIKKIRAHPILKATPIMVISSFYLQETAKDAWKAGANKCLSKNDCTPEIALTVIDQLLVKEPTFNTEMRNRRAEPNTEIHMKEALADTPAPPPEISRAKTGSIPMPSSAPSIAMPSIQMPGTSALPPGFDPLSPPATPQSEAEVTRFWSRSSVEMRPAENSHTAELRMEVRQEFLKRVPKLENEMRDRINSLIKSKPGPEQVALLDGLNQTVSSLSSLAGVTGVTRVAHLSSALEVLIKELQRRPAQLTSSTMRTITHTVDCLTLLFKDSANLSSEAPQSSLIMIVDDEPISRRTVTNALAKANLKSVSFDDPQLALRIAQENKFDLIFLDAEMPGMNGFELCKELRKLPSNKNAIVVFVTSLTNFDSRAQSSLAGGNDLIAKPFLMIELAVKALTYILKPKPPAPAPGGAPAKV